MLATIAVYNLWVLLCFSAGSSSSACQPAKVRQLLRSNGGNCLRPSLAKNLALYDRREWFSRKTRKLCEGWRHLKSSQRSSKAAEDFQTSARFICFLRSFLYCQFRHHSYCPHIQDFNCVFKAPL